MPELEFAIWMPSPTQTLEKVKAKLQRLTYYTSLLHRLWRAWLVPQPYLYGHQHSADTILRNMVIELGGMPLKNYSPTPKILLFRRSGPLYEEEYDLSG